MPARERAIAVAGEDDLALFGDLESTRDRAGRLRHHRAVGRSAAATERTAAAVEEREANRVLRGPRGKLCLGGVEREVRRHGSALLCGVRVAEHDLERAAGCDEPALYRFELEHCIEDVARVPEIENRLEQRHDVELWSGVRRTCPLRQRIHRRNIGRAPREAHHVAVTGRRTETLLQ